MIKLSCIAVDDEPLALELVCAFIRQTPFLELAGQFTSAIAALNHLHQTPADLLFLDIQMPDLSGTDLARVLDKGQPGQGGRIIFTTAFNQYALEGYRLDALDYLLKPFNYVEFLRAANKALAYAGLHQKNSDILNIPAPLPAAENEFLFLKVEYQLVRIALSDILYIEGLKDYVKVHLQSAVKPILSLTSLKALEEKLPATKFMRIHRSYIVALDKIQSITRQSVQIGAVTITVTDQYKEQFSAFTSRWT